MLSMSYFGGFELPEHRLAFRAGHSVSLVSGLVFGVYL